MSKSSWSDSLINLVGSQSVRFQQTPVVHWLELNKAPEDVRELLRDTNLKLAAIEDDGGLNADGIKQRRAELAKQALAALDKLIEPAQRATARRIDALNQALGKVIEKPADAAVASEIRAHIAKQSSPIFAALALKNDPQTVSALVGAPSYLSGLSDADVATLKAQVIGSRVEQKEITEIQQALGIVQAAVKSAAGMINERAQLRAGASLDDLRAKATAKAG